MNIHIIITIFINLFYKINSKWNKYLTMKEKETKFLEDNIGNSLLNLGVDKEFLKNMAIITERRDWWIWLHFVVVQLISCVSLFVNPWTVACQAPLSFMISQSFFKFKSTESVILSNHLMLCCLLLCLHQGLSQWVSASHQAAKVLEL